MSIACFLTYRQAHNLKIRHITDGKCDSLPVYHTAYIAFWCVIPAGITLILWEIGHSFFLEKGLLAAVSDNWQEWSAVDRQLTLTIIRNIAAGVLENNDPTYTAALNYLHDFEWYSRLWRFGFVFCCVFAGLSWGWCHIRAELKAQQFIERIMQFFLLLCAVCAVFITVAIIFSLLFEALRFFNRVPLSDFLFGINWSPQGTIEISDNEELTGSFGVIPLFVGTLLISTIAIGFAAPLGLMSAIYLSEYASKKIRSIIKPVIEILAGIPTIVYGVFAALTVAPLIGDLGRYFDLPTASENALATGLVMGVMIIPFISSLADDVISSVPDRLREGSLAVGATRSETIIQVVLPAALPGIISGLLLAISRAIGETMIVVMAAGLIANLTINPLQAVTTMTVQIVTLLVGDQEFDSAKTLAAFALGLFLFTITLCLNIIALYVVKTYRERYE